MIILNISKTITAVSALVCLGLGIVNALQEYGQLSTESAIYESLTVGAFIISPFVVTYLWLLRPARRECSVLSLIASAAVSFFGLFAYVSYVAGGASDPETSAHMHVYAFPALHFVLAVGSLIMASTLNRALAWLATQIDNKAKHGDR